MHQPPIVTSTAGDSETLRTADTQAKSVATATLTITYHLSITHSNHNLINIHLPILKVPLQPHSTITPHLYENMSAVRAPNHPATFNGHFQPITDYGYVKTPSFFQCGGVNFEKNEDFEVELVTNTALNNTLMADSIYALSGKLFALNDGSTPTLSYFQDSVIRIGATGPEQPDFTNKSIVTSLGMVISRREVASNVSDSGSHLEVIVAHCDWDGQVRFRSILSSLPDG
ncbi:hypothetical protein PGT21_011717 [Puccinia graminis f. sp. tritici]|uniref:Uncharacterized protein n=1 Tax=Puccinia graminis f. sp. tritici TaxID=56615 RepID=A0A5B0Q2G8_PUCGR|nr:hypothetical protein PGT21_011717 [Puccinia graminis f. sp. tritici]